MLDAVLSFACDLDRGIDRTLIRPALLTGDKQAHTFRLAVTRSGVNADIAGAGVSAYFVRADGVTVPITGSVEGSAALVTLPDGCYRVPGRFQLVVKLSTGSGISTVFWGDGAVASSSTDVMLDTEDVIPSLDELLAQIAATEAAAEHANSAAASANTAASGANSAASSASTAAIRANAAAASIESIGAEATTLAPGSAATASWSTVDGTKVLTIGVPQGIQGEKGDKGDKGDPGADGSGSVSSVNGVEPVQGNVTLAASDVGALPEDGTAADAGMLGGKAPEYYIQPRNLLDNSDFAHPVNSQGKSSYTANGYTIDRWMIYSGSGNQAMSLQDGILYFKGYLYQYVPVSDDVTCTFAAKFSDGYILCVSGTASQVQSADLGNAHITFYHQSEMPYPQVTISTVDETQPIGLIWAALYEGSYTADTLPPYVPKGIKVEMLNCGVPMHPRNLLDNSYWGKSSEIVNQRGATSYSGGGTAYSIDRWRLWTTATTLTINEGYIANTESFMVQNLENVDTSKTYTLAGCTADGVIHTLQGKFDGNDYINDYLRFVGGSLTVGLKPNSWVWAALYEGSYTADTLPPYVPKGYGAELTECRRYYRRNEFLNCAKTSGNYFSVSASIEMRVVPTAELLTFAPYGSSTITDMSGGSIAIAQTTAGVQRITYANLPTCAAHSAGGLAVNLSADL